MFLLFLLSSLLWISTSTDYNQSMCPFLSFCSLGAPCPPEWMDWLPGLPKVGPQGFSFIRGQLRKGEASQLASKREHSSRIWPITTIFHQTVLSLRLPLRGSLAYKFTIVVFIARVSLSADWLWYPRRYVRNCGPGWIKVRRNEKMQLQWRHILFSYHLVLCIAVFASILCKPDN